jgi:hypothetical protein
MTVRAFSTTLSEALALVERPLLVMDIDDPQAETG